MDTLQLAYFGGPFYAPKHYLKQCHPNYVSQKELDMHMRHMRLSNYPLFMENRDKGGYRVLRWPSALGSQVTFMIDQNVKDPVLKGIFQDRRFGTHERSLMHTRTIAGDYEITVWGMDRVFQPLYSLAEGEHDVSDGACGAAFYEGPCEMA